jgi:hypothetical protein
MTLRMVAAAVPGEAARSVASLTAAGIRYSEKFIMVGIFGNQ